MITSWHGNVFCIIGPLWGIHRWTSQRVCAAIFFGIFCAVARADGWPYSSIPGDTTLQWRHNDRVGASNHQPHDCLLNRLFRRRSKKISKLRVAGLCEGNSPGTGESPTQMASNAENVSIWWRHHGITCSKQNHYLNQCWLIVHRNSRYTFRWDFINPFLTGLNGLLSRMHSKLWKTKMYALVDPRIWSKQKRLKYYFKMGD